MGDSNQESEFADDALVFAQRSACIYVPISPPSHAPSSSALSPPNYLPHRGSSHHLQFLSRHNHQLFAAALPAATDSFVPPSPRHMSASACRSSAQQPYKFTVADGAERENGVLCSSLDPTNPSCLSPKRFHTDGIDLKPILV